ncbi:hypothetical protein TNCV_2607871 [Trichonephila clavipes]|uniref:Uncharacterized protein n=1 Tax=Trichonephila clavipes TaxID=2585209 RepID=A0A8X6RYQ2_TRICX|nr:hypothetical protein TNCV_2607871 [Trichonephila clavipes]
MRKTDFFPEEDTTMSYSGFEPEPTRLQTEGHSHHTGSLFDKYLICTHNVKAQKKRLAEENGERSLADMPPMFTEPRLNLLTSHYEAISNIGQVITSLFS